MIYNIYKLLAILGLAFLSIIIFALGQVNLIEGKHLFNKYIDTEFAENYSPDKFEQIEIGMTHNQVIEIIGEPLSKSGGYNNTNKTYWYTDDGKLLDKANENGQKSYDDCAWYRSSIGFNKDDIVVVINKGWSFD